MTEAPMPICVDLDGALTRASLSLEALILLLKRNPGYLVAASIWRLQGEATLNAEVSRRVRLDVASLPYNTTLISWLREERSKGRRIWLCTRTNYRHADAVAAHIGLFAGVVASSDSEDLTPGRMAEKLQVMFRGQRFDYVATSTPSRSKQKYACLEAGARRAAGGSGSQLRDAVNAPTEFTRRGGIASGLFRVMRPHQWAKNILVFVPLAAAHRMDDLASAISAMIAFIAFVLCSSSVYLVNDMLDLESDRQHPRKRNRPFAACELPLGLGLALAPLLLLAAMVVSLSLPTKFSLVLLGYFVLTLAYSFVLKRIILVDVMTLAGLYALRIIAGAAAIITSISFWMMLFAVFLFLSLALAKRYSELESMRRKGAMRASGRGYSIEDLPILQNFGATSGYAAVLVLALYIHSPAVEALYGQPEAIWALCILLLYWISRIWIKAHRGVMHEDPVVFALKDRVSLAVALLAALAVVLAI